MGAEGTARRQHVLYSTADEFTIAPAVTAVADTYAGRVNIGSYPELHHAYYKVRLTADGADDALANEAIDALRHALDGGHDDDADDGLQSTCSTTTSSPRWTRTSSWRATSTRCPRDATVGEWSRPSNSSVPL